MKNNAVGWFEIYVDNMVRAKRFYEAVFQIKLEKLANPQLELWSFPGSMDNYGAPGALVKMDGFKAGGNSILVYFSCQDCAVEEARVAQYGGRIEKSKYPIGEYGFISIVIDTEGNMFGLHSIE
jgi:uncharacterized protein